MKISKIHVYQTDLPMSGEPYKLSGGRSYTSFDSTIVRVETNEGIDGWGEICPWGMSYLPEFAARARAALNALAPTLIGLDPTNLYEINAHMDRTMYGHGYAKCAIDVACWDILGKSADEPVYTMLGGRVTDTIPFLASIYCGTPAEMLERIDQGRAQGVELFSTKASGDPLADISMYRTLAKSMSERETFLADANKGWSLTGAARVVKAIEDLGYILEQPCEGYDACLSIRRRTQMPMILDEVVVDFDVLARIAKDDAADVVHVKVSRVGGLTKSRILRDFCTATGLAARWSASGGSKIADAAAAHIAFSTPASAPNWFWSCQEFTASEWCNGGPAISGGVIELPDSPGLGVEPDKTWLGKPVVTY